MPLADFFSCFVRRLARGKMPLHAGREHFHFVLMRAGLSGRQVLAVLVAFSVLYAAVGLIGASEKLPDWALFAPWLTLRSEEHTSELQSPDTISYAVFCLKKKKTTQKKTKYKNCYRVI